jgi:hypothetical protein
MAAIEQAIIFNLDVGGLVLGRRLDSDHTCWDRRAWIAEETGTIAWFPAWS